MRHIEEALIPGFSPHSPPPGPGSYPRARGLVVRQAGGRPSWCCGRAVGNSGQLGVHWNITVLDPSELVTMLETACCDPLFMQ